VNADLVSKEPGEHMRQYTANGKLKQQELILSIRKAHTRFSNSRLDCGQLDFVAAEHSVLALVPSVPAGPAYL